MSKELALGLVIGGAVNASVGKAFGDIEGRIKRLDSVAGKAKVLQSVIGETRRLQDEWRKAHTMGAASAEGLRRKLEANLDALKRQGVEVGNLGRAYEKMGRAVRVAELKTKGQQQIQQGGEGLRSVGKGVAAGVAAMVIPTKVSADFGAIIRDIAIKAGVANKPQEAQMSKTIIDTSRDTGMARNDVAEVVNALVGAGMDLSKALEYAPTAAKFVVGQGADGADTAKMINALGQNARITDPKEMQKALEGIAFQGQAGSFEASDMARWFPELLAGMGKLGITGNDAVSQLGAMLQVQMKTAGGTDEAANNLKNWMEKIGSGDTVEAYKKVGIDYQGSMNGGLQKGLSTLESSFALAQKYIAATDPKKAAAMSKAMAKISTEADPAKAKEMMASLEQALRTGDLFADMQVKAALTGFMQNKKLYEQLKNDSRDATGILDKNLAERRESSSQKWAEMAQGMDDAMRSIGDSLRPITDSVATGLTSVARSLGGLSDEYPRAAAGAVSLGAGVASLASLFSAYKIAKGVLNLGKATLMGNPNLVQKVQVVNGLGGSGGGGGPDLGDASHERDKRPKGRKRGPGRAAASSAAPNSAKPRMQVYSDGSRVQAKPTPLSSWTPPTETPKAAAASATVKPGGVRPGSFAKGALPFVLLDAGLQAKDVYDNAETRDEKAEGYGSVAGNVAGALAGAAAGAAIGSVVPVIGTVIGGLIGGYLGSMGGAALGGYAGKAAFGSPSGAAAGGGPVTPMLMGPRPGPAVPSLATMAGSFASTPTTTASEYKPQPLDPSVSYDPSDPNSADPFLMKNPYGKKVRFPGASQVNDPERLAAMETMRKALAPAPMVAPSAVTGNGPSSAVPDMNALANSFKASDGKAPVAAMMAPIKAATPSGPPKVEQQNTFSPVFQITVQGDAKDPQKLAQEMMPEIQRMMTGMAQQTARSSNYDDPHV